MSRFGRKDGLIVAVADEKDHRYGAGWKKLADGETYNPPARRTRAAEETSTGQIRRQQAAQDPFN